MNVSSYKSCPACNSFDCGRPCNCYADPTGTDFVSRVYYDGDGNICRVAFSGTSLVEFYIDVPSSLSQPSITIPTNCTVPPSLPALNEKITILYQPNFGTYGSTLYSQSLSNGGIVFEPTTPLLTVSGAGGTQIPSFLSGDIPSYQATVSKGTTKSTGPSIYITNIPQAPLKAILRSYDVTQGFVTVVVAAPLGVTVNFVNPPFVNTAENGDVFLFVKGAYISFTVSNYGVYSPTFTAFVPVTQGPVYTLNLATYLTKVRVSGLTPQTSLRFTPNLDTSSARFIECNPSTLIQGSGGSQVVEFFLPRNFAGSYALCYLLPNNESVCSDERNDYLGDANIYEIDVLSFRPPLFSIFLFKNVPIDTGATTNSSAPSPAIQFSPSRYSFVIPVSAKKRGELTVLENYVSGLSAAIQSALSSSSPETLLVVMVTPNNADALSFLPTVTINSGAAFVGPAVPFTANPSSIIQQPIDVFPYFSLLTVSVPYNGLVTFQTPLSPTSNTSAFYDVYSTNQVVTLPVGVTLYFKLMSITKKHVGQIQSYTVLSYPTQTLLLSDLFVNVKFTEPPPQGTQAYLSIPKVSDRVFANQIQFPDANSATPPLSELPPYVTLTGINACVGGALGTSDCTTAPNYLVGYFPGALRVNSYDASDAFVGVKVINIPSSSGLYFVKNVGQTFLFLSIASNDQILTLIKGNVYNTYQCPQSLSLKTISIPNLNANCILKQYSFNALASLLDYNNF